MRLITFIAVLLCACALAAAPLPPAARAEVDVLLDQLQASACEFNRNGSWYSAADAKAHLLRKLDYLEGKSMVQTAQQFIELGASKSSSTGQPYWVKCAGAPAQESRQWLTDKLKALRPAPTATPTNLSQSPGKH